MTGALRIQNEAVTQVDGTAAIRDAQFSMNAPVALMVIAKQC
jgi:hypothetical protein